MSTRRRTSSASLIGQRSRIDLAIEALTLIGLILVPLIFRGREWVAFYSQPKLFVLHFVALSIALLWGLELALNAATSREPTTISISQRLDAWIGAARHRWLLVTVIGFGLVFVASTLLSPMPLVSAWGRDFGDLGYELYSTLSFLVIFFAVALRTRATEQLLRIMYVFAGVGTLSAAYAVSQAYGWDPIGRGEDLKRVIGSFGNPLFLGAYLVMSIPIVMALILHEESRDRRWTIVPAVVAIGLQFAALWYAGGRGPLIGSVVGLISFVIITLIWLDFRRGLKAAGVGVAGVATAIVLMSFPGGDSETGRGLDQWKNVFSTITSGVQYIYGAAGDPAPITFSETPTPTVTPTESPAPETGERDDGSAATTAAPPEATDSLTTEPPMEAEESSSGVRTLSGVAGVDIFEIADTRSLAIGQRADIWRGALELAYTRDSVGDESDMIRAFRFLFGYGPDMYFYSYPLTARPIANLEATSHTHNYALQVLLEQGIAGLVMLVATGVLGLITAFSVIRRRDRDSDPALAILVVGAVAALIARALEQSSGVGRVSDLMAFWAILGIVFAAAEIDQGLVVRSGRSMRRPISTAGFRRLTPIGFVVIAGLVALVVFVQKDVQTLRAGWIAADGFEQKRNGDANAALASFEKAHGLAPDVERYVSEVSKIYSASAAVSDPERGRELVTAAREALLEYEDRDGSAWQTQMALASTTASLAELGDGSRVPEAINRYLRLSDLMPGYVVVQALAAEKIVRLGEYELGLDMAARAIALESVTRPVKNAWWAMGEALFQLDRDDEAELAWQTALTRSGPLFYKGISFRGLAFVYELRGNLQRASFYHGLADEILVN